jgi:hypothetical protein
LSYKLFFVFPFCFLLLRSQTVDKNCQIGYGSIKESELIKNLSVLTDDSLEGRETGYPGQRKAANFIADNFRGLGLKPVGDNKTYFQNFNVEITQVDRETKIITDIRGVKKIFKWGIDFTSDINKDTTICGKPVFIGFNDLKMDSIELEKLTGKIVLIFIGKDNFGGNKLKVETIRKIYSIGHYSNALATLIIPDPEGPASFQNIMQAAADYGLDKGYMRLNTGYSISWQKPLKFIISPIIADDLLKSVGKTLEQVKYEVHNDRKFTPLYIDSATITIEERTNKELRQTENVVSLLTGSDPGLKKQTVAVTSHYDHLGKTSNGLIYRGADDNGSGTVTLLEIAKAFAKNPIKPKNDVLFIAFVGEEKGLFGSQYYTTNPVIPFDQTLADINADMIGRLDPKYAAMHDTNYIYVIGSDKISIELDSIIQAANNESSQLKLDYTYNSDQDPEQYYRRSDHFNFAKNGVPVAFFFSGLNDDYHQPTDSKEKIIYTKIKKTSQLIFTLLWKLANLDRPLTKVPALQ